MPRPKSKKLKVGNGQGSVTLRGDGRWMARFTTESPETGQPARRTLYGKSEQEARAKLIAALAERQQGSLTVTAGRGPTLVRWVEAWLAQSQVRPKTKQRYGELLAYATAELGTVPLTRLSVRHIEGLLAGLREKKLSARTVNHVRATLRNVLHDAERRGLVQRNVVDLTRSIRVDDEPELGVLDADQVKVLMEVAKDHYDGIMWITALATAMRQSELVGLTWGQVDLDLCQVKVTRTLQLVDGEWLTQPPKSRRSRRTIPLAKSACEALRQHQREGRLRAGQDWPMQHGDLVFREADGQPVNGENLTKRFQYQLKKAGLPRIRFHDLRASAATFMALAGLPVAVAQAVLGHASAALTLNIYTRIRPDLAREAADTMDAVMTR